MPEAKPEGKNMPEQGTAGHRAHLDALGVSMVPATLAQFLSFWKTPEGSVGLGP